MVTTIAIPVNYNLNASTFFEVNYGYARNALVQLRRVREGTTIAEDHMRNRQMIIRWLMANTKAIEQRTRDGKTYLVMVDPKAFREGVGRLAVRRLERWAFSLAVGGGVARQVERRAFNLAVGCLASRHLER